MAKRNHQPLDIDGILMGKQFESFERTIKEHKVLQLVSQEALDRLKLGQCRLAHLNQGTAIIEAPSAVWLNRLKQLRFQLLSELRNQLPSLITLEFTINPKLANIKPEPSQKIIKQRVINPQVEQHIGEIKEKLKQLKNKT